MLGVGGFLIWYFLFRKKPKPNGNGDSGNSESSEKKTNGNGGFNPNKTNGNGGFNPNKTNGGKGLKPKTKPTKPKKPFSISNIFLNAKNEGTNGAPFSITLDPTHPGTSGSDKIALLLNEKTSCQNYHFIYGDFITPGLGPQIPNALIWQGAKDTILCRTTFGTINTQFAVLQTSAVYARTNQHTTKCQWFFEEISKGVFTICNPTPKSEPKMCLRTCTECTYPKMRIDPLTTNESFHFAITQPGVENNKPGGVVCLN